MTMAVGSLILAGGLSSRLGGSAKWNLRLGSETLLERTVAAVRSAGASPVVVVGDEGPDGVVAVRERPAFTGPVAAIAAGLRALPEGADRVLVLACDMPGVGAIVPVLLAETRADGAIAVDRGRRQHLAFVARASALHRALASLPTVVGTAVRELHARLDMHEVPVPDGATDDIDTWDDVARFGAVAPTPGRIHG